MIDQTKTAVALRRPRSGDLFVSPEVRHLLEQSERAFRLARAMTNRADAEWLEQIGRSFLEQARRVADEEGAANGSVSREAGCAPQ
jgi:hypothetical protein